MINRSRFFWIQMKYCSQTQHFNMVCPTRYRTHHFFNNFTTNEDITTKFEADYRLIPLHFSHKERTPVQISLQYLHGVRIIKEIPGSVASGTHCICHAMLRVTVWLVFEMFVEVEPLYSSLCVCVCRARVFGARVCLCGARVWCVDRVCTCVRACAFFCFLCDNGL